MQEGSRRGGAQESVVMDGDGQACFSAFLTEIIADVIYEACFLAVPAL